MKKKEQIKKAPASKQQIKIEPSAKEQIKKILIKEAKKKVNNVKSKVTKKVKNKAEKVKAIVKNADKKIAAKIKSKVDDLGKSFFNNLFKGPSIKGAFF